MKAKKTAPPRRRISFAVDRDEIEINSDWVEAVMATPAPSTVVVPFPSPPPAPEPEVFFAPVENNATVEPSATGERCTSVEKTAPVAENAPVALIATEENAATVAVLEETAPGEQVATVAVLRVARPRPILRITDGLTPGQYAVYSLMYEAGEPAADRARIYKGGYADLGRLTGLSKRGLQNIVAELQAKHVLTLHQHPGYHRTETSAYLVPSPEAVLRTWAAKGWSHAVGKSKNLTA